MGERSVRLFGVWFSSSKYICISPSASVLVSDGYVTTSTFTNSNDSQTSTGSISFTNSFYGSICDTFMNNGYKGNLSLGNYTIENKEKLEFQTHGFTGDPKKVSFHCCCWRYGEIFNCYLLSVTVCDNTLHCTQRQLTVLTLCLPREVRADGT